MGIVRVYATKESYQNRDKTIKSVNLKRGSIPLRIYNVLDHKSWKSCIDIYKSKDDNYWKIRSKTKTSSIAKACLQLFNQKYIERKRFGRRYHYRRINVT